EEDTRSGTTSEEEGEPLLTAHLAGPARDSLLAHARRQEQAQQTQEQAVPKEEQAASKQEQKREEPSQWQEAPPAASQVPAEDVQRVEAGGRARDTGAVAVEGGPLGPGEEAFAWGRYGGWQWERLEREWTLHWTAWGDV